MAQAMGRQASNLPTSLGEAKDAKSTVILICRHANTPLPRPLARPPSPCGRGLEIIRVCLNPAAHAVGYNLAALRASGKQKAASGGDGTGFKISDSRFHSKAVMTPPLQNPHTSRTPRRMRDPL